jgi:nitrate/nitrite transporter NarK
MKGRLVMQFLLVLCEGIFLIFFANCPSFHMATIVLVVFSIFVQAANGSCFSIVPYVSPYKGESTHPHELPALHHSPLHFCLPLARRSPVFVCVQARCRALWARAATSAP